MKKIFKIICVLCFVLLISANCFGDEISITEKLSSPSTESEQKTETGQTEYTIMFDNKDTGKKITIHEYSPKIGDVISFRAFIEAMDGSIRWEPNTETRHLGYFEFLGSEYRYESHYDLYNISNKETQFAINIYKLVGEKEILLGMSNGVESMYTKFIDNTIYVRLNSLRRLMPRMGYIFNIDKKNKTFNIKTYDFNSEKEILLSKFPVEKFGKGFYGKEYSGYSPAYTKENLYYCNDVFEDQVSDTETMESRYYNYINQNYKNCYIQDKDEFYKDLLQAEYLTFIDDVKIYYDKDLDAYIVYNKDFMNVNKLDHSYKILVVRKFDNMLIYKY